MENDENKKSPEKKFLTKGIIGTDKKNLKDDDEDDF